jgi:hypothetical protein
MSGARQLAGFARRICQAKTGAYTVTKADVASVLLVSGTWTLGLPAVATVSNGFTVTVRNTGSGLITVDPNSAETVNAAATLGVAPGDTIDLICDGTGWQALFSDGRLAVRLAANAQYMVFDLEPDTLYRGAAKMRALADDTLYAQIATAPGTWLTTSSYTYQQSSASSTVTIAGAATSTNVPIAGLDASSSWGGLLDFLFFSGNASESAHILLTAGGLNSDGNVRIYFTDAVCGNVGGAAQVRFGLGTSVLMAGSRCSLQKVG